MPLATQLLHSSMHATLTSRFPRRPPTAPPRSEGQRAEGQTFEKTGFEARPRTFPWLFVLLVLLVHAAPSEKVLAQNLAQNLARGLTQKGARSPQLAPSVEALQQERRNTLKKGMHQARPLLPMVSTLLSFWRDADELSPMQAASSRDDLVEEALRRPEALHPAFRAHLLWLQAWHHGQRGDLKAQETALRALGVPDRFDVLGPLPESQFGGSTLPDMLDPKAPPNASAAFPGQPVTVRWRPVAASPQGALHLDEAFPMVAKSCALVHVRVTFLEDGEKGIHFGVDGQSTLWWDGEPVFSSEQALNKMQVLHKMQVPNKEPAPSGERVGEADHGADADRAMGRTSAYPERAAVRVRGDRGSHQLLLRTCTETAPWRVYLRIDDESASSARAPAKSVGRANSQKTKQRDPTAANVIPSVWTHEVLPRLRRWSSQHGRRRSQDLDLMYEALVYGAETRAFDQSDAIPDEAIRQWALASGKPAHLLLAASLLDHRRDRLALDALARRTCPRDPRCLYVMAAVAGEGWRPERALFMDRLTNARAGDAVSGSDGAIAEGAKSNVENAPSMGFLRLPLLRWQTQILRRQGFAIRAWQLLTSGSPRDKTLSHEHGAEAEQAQGSVKGSSIKQLLEEARTAEAAGLDVQARQRYRAIVQHHAHNEEALRVMLNTAVRRADREEVLRWGAQLEAHQPHHHGSMLRVAEAYTSVGLNTAAKRVFLNLLKQSPDSPEIQVAWGQWCLMRGEHEHARSAFAHALLVRPQDPETRRLLISTTRHLRGKKDPRGGSVGGRGAGAYDTRHTPQRGLSDRRSRDGSPPRKSRALNNPTPGQKGPHQKGEVAFKPLKVQALKDIALPGAGHGYVLLAHHVQQQVYTNGLGTRFHQQVARIVNAQGAKAWRQYPIGYEPERQRLTILKARVIRTNGDILESTQSFEQSLSEPWFRLYYDARARIIALPPARQGDLVEVQYRIDDIATQNFFEDYFGELFPFMSPVPTANMQYRLLFPKERRIFHRLSAQHSLAASATEERDASSRDASSRDTSSRDTSSNAPGTRSKQKTGSIVFDKQEGQNLSQYTWTSARLPAHSPEPRSPGHTETAPYLHMSTYKDWSEVGAWYWNLIRSQLVASTEIKNAVQQLRAEVLARGASGARIRNAAPNKATQHKATQHKSEVPANPEAADRSPRADGETRAMVRAIYDWVIRRTRYVGLEFGIHGFKPYRVPDVVERGFGDCKDKASLLYVMLREAGIDARIVLIRTSDKGRVAEAPASLSVFNHAIAYVPALDLYLDGTAEFHGAEELPFSDQGASALRVGPNDSTFVTTPYTPAKHNVRKRTLRVALREDGGAEMSGTEEVEGGLAPGFRRRYESPGTREQRLASDLAEQFAGASLRASTFARVNTREGPVSVHYEASVAHYAERKDMGSTQETASFRMPISEQAEELSALRLEGTRSQSFVLGEAQTWQESRTLVAPKGWRIDSDAQNRSRSSAHASFSLDVQRPNARTITFTHTLTFKNASIPAKDMNAFQRFLKGVIEDLRGEATMRPDSR